MTSGGIVANGGESIFGNPGSRCTVCRQLLTAASRVSTWCGHQCCENCVAKISTSSGMFLVCPECSVQPTDSNASTNGNGNGGGPMTSFQFSYAPANLFVNQQQPECRLCNRKSRDLVAKCMTCNSEMCRDCSHQHSVMSYLSSHHVVPLTNGSAMSINSSSDQIATSSNGSMSGSGSSSVSPSSLSISNLVLSSAPSELQSVSESLREVSRYNLRQYDTCMKSIEEVFHILTDTLERRRSEMYSELKFKFEGRLSAINDRLTETESLRRYLEQSHSGDPFLFNSAADGSVMISDVFAQQYSNCLSYKAQLDDLLDVAFISELSDNREPIIPFGRLIWSDNRSRGVSLKKNGTMMASKLFSQPAIRSILGSMNPSPVPDYNRAVGPDVSSTSYGGSSLVSSTWENPSGPVPDVFATADMFVSDESRPSSGKSTPTGLVKRSKLAHTIAFGDTGVEEGEFSEPSGVCVNIKTGDILVADANNHRVQVFNKEGKFLMRIGTAGKQDGALAYPNRVAVCPRTGNIVITERNPTHQVQIFTGQGNFLRKFGSNVLKNPRGLAVDRRGNIIIAECKVHNVVVFNQNTGSVMHQFSLIGSVEFPNGLAVNQDCNRIYITDNHKHCVKVFTYSGLLESTIGGHGITNFPIGVGVSANGNVVVADNHTNFNVTMFDANGSIIAAFESTSKHSCCYSVAFADDGTVVLTSKDNRVFIYKCPLPAQPSQPLQLQLQLPQKQSQSPMDAVTEPLSSNGFGSY